MPDAATAEVVIIGAGPVGLFQIFELGLLGMSAHIVDTLAQPGGQCTELYPDKPIYDIPALPVCGAQELIDRLLQQVKPFHATFHLGQEVTELRRGEDGRFLVGTAAGTQLNTGAVVIAGGVGSFQPRRLSVPGIEEFEGRQVLYRVRTAADFHGKDLIICGGGDSALDWTVALCEKARSLTLVHRRA
jgi:thioredoxin reductase (NADPH)